jgi:hypothetical protein
MKRFKIYTEDKNQTAISELVGEFFDGFTVNAGLLGFWKGTSEASISIEIITDASYADAAIEVIAERIKVLNRQEAVLVTVEDISAKFI